MCLAIPGRVLEAPDVGLNRIANGPVWRRYQADLPGFRPRSQPRRLRPGPRGIRHQRDRSGRSRTHLCAAGRDGRASTKTRRADGEVHRRVSRPADCRIPGRGIRARVTRPWVLMEICGGQTHTIMRYGLDELLPPRSRTGARARMPGLRDAARDRRQGHRHRLAPGRDLRLVRRHAARAGLALRPVPREGARAAMCASPTRPWTR